MTRNRVTVILLTVLLPVVLGSCTSGGGSSIDQTKPEAVVQALFDVARSRNFDLLGGLCDPLRENDGDTDCLCAFARDYQPHKCVGDDRDQVTEDQYIQAFEKGKIQGAPRIEGDRAEVDFLFGPGGDDEETMNLVLRDGKWYLESF